MNQYVVCMDSAWVRDSEMFDMTGLSDEDLADIDVCSTENKRRWYDMEPTPFIAVVKADTEEVACQMAAARKRYDPRCLFAVKVL